jgi:hypothetical protein
MSFSTSVIAIALLLGQGCPPVPPDNGDNGDGDGNGPVTGQFIGSERCQSCHLNIHDNWEETLHSNALATLEDMGEGNNPNCLPCHVVGFNESGGFESRSATPNLAGVGCESCHGPAADHAQNASEEELLPPVDLTSEVCGRCHTGDNQPHYDEWQESGHSEVTEVPADDFNQGILLNNCGACHSGDYFYLSILKGQELADDFLEGVAPSSMLAVECAICHDPHAQTGNAPEPEDGRDFQLRFPEVANPSPSSSVEDVTDRDRFNLCGQCHHSRGRTWEATTRGPHPSNQNNVYASEMPVPEGADPLVLSRTSVHSFAREQCATCHMYRRETESELSPDISGHTFEVDQQGCDAVGCHPSQEQAVTAQNVLQNEVDIRLESIANRLGDPSTWEYSAEGGPENQEAISEEVKKIRFLYHYVLSDGSLGVHNPDYIREILTTAEGLLNEIGM